MLVVASDAQSRDGVSQIVDLDQHCGLVSGYPCVVAGRNVDNCGSLQFDDATVRELEVQRTVSEEPDVGVVARFCTGQRLQVDAPPHAGRVDRSFDASVSDRGNVDLDRSECLVLDAVHRGEQGHAVIHGRMLLRAVWTGRRTPRLVLSRAFEDLPANAIGVVEGAPGPPATYALSCNKALAPP
ncbi:MAG: hypothetical protein JWM12_3167, partial [Ilumatobacteraceae bacterium]|nr:hypothetical protein [Ilumatobacteraceae bacterium]